MALPTGQIALSQVNTELSLSSTASITMNDAAVRTLANVPTGQIALSNLQGKSSFSRTKGYFLGGSSSSGVPPGPKQTAATTSHIDGILFSNDTSFNPGATLTRKRDAAGQASSTTRGYVVHGNAEQASINSPRQQIEGIIFSNETNFVISNSGIMAPQRPPGDTFEKEILNPASAASSTKGYFAGGSKPDSAASRVHTSEIVTFTFSSETSSIPGQNLSAEGRSGAGLSSSTKGFFCGQFVSGDVGSTDVDGITFSNDTAFSSAGSITRVPTTTVVRYAGASSTVKGYLASDVTMCGYTFSSESGFDVGVNLPDGNRGSAGSVASTSKGYFGGGGPKNGGADVSHIDGILFSNDTTFNPAATLGDGIRTFISGVQF